MPFGLCRRAMLQAIAHPTPARAGEFPVGIIARSRRGGRHPVMVVLRGRNGCVLVAFLRRACRLTAEAWGELRSPFPSCPGDFDGPEGSGSDTRSPGTV